MSAPVESSERLKRRPVRLEAISLDRSCHYQRGHVRRLPGCHDSSHDLGAVGGLAAAIGPSLGAAMIEHFGWSSVFFLNLPVGAAVFFLGRRILPESRDQDGSRVPSPVGIVLSMLAMGLLTFAVIQSGSEGWLDRHTLSPLLMIGLASAPGSLLVLGSLLFAAAGLWPWFGLARSPACPTQWLAATILGGVANGLTIAPPASASAHDLGPSRFAIGGAFNGAVRQLGGVIGVALAFHLRGPNTRLAELAAFKPVFLLMAVCGLASAALSAGINTQPKAWP